MYSPTRLSATFRQVAGVQRQDATHCAHQEDVGQSVIRRQRFDEIGADVVRKYVTFDIERHSVPCQASWLFAEHLWSLPRQTDRVSDARRRRSSGDVPILCK